MPETTYPQPLRIPIGRNVTYAVRGMPKVANQYGPGFLLPTEISLTYRATEDSQLGRFHAYVKGQWLRDGEQVPSGEKLPGQHYYGDPAGWPEWLAAEARMHDPDAAVPSAPVDRAALLGAAAARFEERAATLTDGIDDLAAFVAKARMRDAEVWKAAATLLRAMADCPACEAGIEHTEHCPTPETHNWGCGCPSDVAAAIASCPCHEMSPSPCRCPCYGCKHHCGAHNPDDVTGPSRVAGEAQQPTPCSQPNPCEDGELCATHEEEQAHTEGEHEYCGPTCEVEFPSDKLRNTILCRAVPGSAGMLDELLRRAAAGHLPAVEAQQAETQAEDPARIDRLRPEFTEHASVESIDVQLRRARSQLRRWHLRVEWLISLRQARLEQKARGEWPAAVSQPGKEQAAKAPVPTLASRCDACRHTLNWHTNQAGCTVVLCTCSRFQHPAEEPTP